MTPRPDRDKDREQARLRRMEKARLAREATDRAERRRRVLVFGSLGIVAVLLVGLVVGVVVDANRSADTAATTAPIRASADTGIVVGDADAPDEVVVYLDYQCPFCRQLETETGPWLDEQVDAGSISVQYHVVSILDRVSDGYSTRAANAAACVADDPAADYTAFNEAMFAQQPEEGGSGLPDSTLVQIAEQAGAGDDVATCIADGTYEPWVEHMTEEASDAGHTSTPTVLVNGNVVQGAGGALPGETEIAAALAS